MQVDVSPLIDMKTEFIDIPLSKNETKKRFEIEVGGHFAFIDYRELGNQFALVHTETHPELANTGAAMAVIEKTLIWIEQHNKTALPFCPLIFAYIKKHPEWKRIVDKRFKAYDKL